MKASIIVLTFNSLEEATKPCIESIYKYTKLSDFEIICVDNNSTDATRSYLGSLSKKYTNLQIILNNENRGFAAANNQGIDASRGDYIILLNNDTLVTPNWLNLLLEPFSKTKSIGLVGPISNSVGNEQMVYINGINEKNYVDLSNQYCMNNTGIYNETNRLGFFCVSFKRDLVQKIGKLDEAFGMGYFEDDDFCLRALKKKYKLLINEQCFVYHKGSVSFKKVSRDHYNELIDKNRSYIERKHNIITGQSELIEAYINFISAEINKVPEGIQPAGRIKARLPGLSALPRYLERSKPSHRRSGDSSFSAEGELLKILRENKYKGIIIYPPTIDWNLPLFQRPQHIAKEMAKIGYLFLYCTTNTYDKVVGYQKISENLYLTDQFDNIVNSLHSGWILFDAAHPIYTLDDLASWKSRGYKIIYHYVDKIDSQLVKDKKILGKILARHNKIDSNFVDLVVVTSKYLLLDFNGIFPTEKIIYSPNGVDYQHFNIDKSKRNLPMDLIPLIKKGHPIIGYYGALASWIDYELINELAKQRPGYEIVLIGWDFDNSLNKRLIRNKNVHYLGLKTYDELPQYSIWFDVSIIPFEKGKIAQSTSPIKLFEYMASGKPVVCTKDLNECEGYDGVIVAKDNSNFIKEVDAMHLKAKKLESTLKNQAKLQSWESRAMDIDKAIDSNSKSYVEFLDTDYLVEEYYRTLEEKHRLSEKRKHVKHDYDKIVGSKAYRLWSFYRFTKAQIRRVVKKVLKKKSTTSSSSIRHKKVVLYFGVIAWDFRNQRPQQIARQLAKNGYRVFYIQNGFTPILSENNIDISIKKRETNIELVKLCATHNLSIYTELPSTDDIKFIRLSLKELMGNLNVADPIMWVNHPFWYQILKDFNLSSPIIYDCMDEHSGFKISSPRLNDIENELFNSASHIITSSLSLFQKASKRRKTHVELLRNGCEYDYFSKASNQNVTPPKELRKLRGPIIGYYGAIAEWFDHELMDKLAEEYPKYNFVLIGDVTNERIREIKERHSNIFLLGEKPYKDIVSYLRYFDVCLIPFMVNDLIKATNPLKLYEYFAAGKAVVTTAIPEVKQYDKFCYFSKTRKEFVKNVEVAVNEKKTSELISSRQEIAKQRDWGIIGDQIIEIIREHESKL